MTGRALAMAGRWTLIALLAIGLVWGVWAGGSALLSRLFFSNPDYAIAAIEVSSDGPVNREQILGTAGVAVGQNIFLVDLQGARSRLTSLPQIEDARIVRQLPHNIAIRIRVRRPVAWIAPSPDAEGESLLRSSFLVDARGFVFPELETDPAHFNLPFIYGCPELPLRPGQALSSRESLAALELLRITSDTPLGVRLQIQQIELSKRYCMEVLDRRRALYLFGTEIRTLREQVDQLAALLAATDSEGRKIQKVNLLMRRNIPVVFAGATPVSGERPPALSASVTPAPAIATAQTPAAAPKARAQTAAAPERRKPSPPRREEARRPEPARHPAAPTPPRRGAHDIPLSPFIANP